MICEEVIKAYLDTLQVGFHCKQSPNGRLSIVTPYLYPDHDNIEIFVRPKDSGVTVSDLGETLRGLDTLGLDIMDTPNALFAARRIAEGFGVIIDHGILVKRGSIGEVGSLVLDLILACQSVSSLVYGSRAYEPALFEDEVEEYLEGHGFNVSRNVKVTGSKSGKRYTVPFRVQTREWSFWISTISPKGSSGVQWKINSNFRMWYDLNGSMTKERKINLLNDDLLAFKDEDVKILEEVSSIYRWTNRHDLIAVLQGSSTASSKSVQ